MRFNKSWNTPSVKEISPILDKFITKDNPTIKKAYLKKDPQMLAMSIGKWKLFSLFLSFALAYTGFRAYYTPDYSWIEGEQAKEEEEGALLLDSMNKNA